MRLPTVLLLTLTSFLTTAFADETESLRAAKPRAPPLVKVLEVKASGSGCPPNTFDAVASNGGNQINLTFGEFIAHSPADKISEKRRFCQLNLKLKFSAGWALSVASTQYQGYIGIQKGLTAEIVTSYYFSGSSRDATTKATVPGPFYDNYNINGLAQGTSWSSCGQEVMLNLKTDVRLLGDGYGFIANEKQKNKFLHLVNVNWRTC